MSSQTPSSPLPLDAPIDQTELVEAVAGLVSPPAVCVKVLALVKSPTASAADFAGLIELDPNLTARVLRIVNSAYYGFRRQIDSLTQAVTIIGIRDLSNIVIALSAVRSFSKLGAGLVSVEDFWRHSVFVALAARRLGRTLDAAAPDSLFVGGLLHDVGSALLYAQHPMLGPWMTAQCASDNGAVDERALARCEALHLEFDHARLGGRLLETWDLPPALCDLIFHHHAPTAGAPDAALVDIADRLAALSEAGALLGADPSPDEAFASIAADCNGALGESELRALLEDVEGDLDATLRTFVN